MYLIGNRQETSVFRWLQRLFRPQGAVIIVNGTRVTPQELEADLGPVLTRTIRQTDDAGTVSLSKQRPPVALELCRMDVGLTLVEESDRRQVELVVRGPQRIINGLIVHNRSDCLKVVGPELALAASVVIQGSFSGSVSVSAPSSELTIEAKVPPGVRLTLDDITGTVQQTGQLGSLNADLGYDTTAVFDRVPGATIDTKNDTTVEIGTIEGDLKAGLGYSTALVVTGGKINCLDLRTQNDSQVRIATPVTGGDATLGYSCRLTLDDVEAETFEVTCLNDTVVSLGTVKVERFEVSLGYSCRLTIKQLDAARFKVGTANDTKVILKAGVANTLTATLGYSCELKARVEAESVVLRVQNDTRVFLGSDLLHLDAELGYSCQLEVGGRISNIKLKAQNDLDAAVLGRIDAGHINVGYSCTVVTQGVGDAVRRRLGYDSELLVNGRAV